MVQVWYEYFISSGFGEVTVQQGVHEALALQ